MTSAFLYYQLPMPSQQLQLPPRATNSAPFPTPWNPGSPGFASTEWLWSLKIKTRPEQVNLELGRVILYYLRRIYPNLVHVQQRHLEVVRRTNCIRVNSVLRTTVPREINYSSKETKIPCHSVSVKSVQWHLLHYIAFFILCLFEESID